MRRFCRRFLLGAQIAFAIAASCGLTNAQQAAPLTGLVRAKRPVPNHYIVVLKESGPTDHAADVDAIAMDLSIQHSGQLGFTYRHALRGFSVQMTEAQALAMAKNPRVAYVEEDGIVTSQTTQTVSNWGLDRIDQRQGTNGTYNYALTGAGVHVYVIDSGIDASNTAFGGRATADADFVNDGRNGSDCGGHGTFVAGILGGSTYGVAKGVRLHGVRVLDCGGNGTDSRTIAGVDWVTNNSMHPAVANMSLGGGSSYTLDVAVRNSIASGVTYVVSAGNENTDVVYKSPAHVMEAITVAASDQNDARVTDSNYGTLVDLFAPGANITSNAIGGPITNGGGTSAAAPFVAGTVARYLQANPGASPATVGNAITAAATKNVVTNPGTGSPNALLYANFPSATVTIAGQESYECRIQTPTVECGGGIIFDSGYVTVTVNGHNYATSYGHGSTRTTIASALAASIQSDPAVTAWSSGSAVTVVSRAFSCFTIGTDYNTSQPSRFNPSFTATASNPGPGCP